MTQSSSTTDSFEPASNPRREAVLRAAATVFLRNGYVGTSVDEISALAAVSKQTVYKHFIDKRNLFTELINATIRDVSDTVHDEGLDLGNSDSIEDDLRVFARRMLTDVMQPAVLQLRRLVIGEATRFPELGRTFYELGPGRTIETLAVAFAQLAEKNVLRIEDAMFAAEHFNWLVMAIPLNRAMFFGDHGIPERSNLERYADAAVQVFLAAYACEPSQSIRGN